MTKATFISFPVIAGDPFTQSVPQLYMIAFFITDTIWPCVECSRMKMNVHHASCFYVLVLCIRSRPKVSLFSWLFFSRILEKRESGECDMEMKNTERWVDKSLKAFLNIYRIYTYISTWVLQMGSLCLVIVSMDFSRIVIWQRRQFMCFWCVDACQQGTRRSPTCC